MIQRSHLERNEVKSRDLRTLTTFQVNALRRSLDSRCSLGMTAHRPGCPHVGAKMVENFPDNLKYLRIVNISLISGREKFLIFFQKH